MTTSSKVLLAVFVLALVGVGFYFLRSEGDVRSPSEAQGIVTPSESVAPEGRPEGLVVEPLIRPRPFTSEAPIEATLSKEAASDFGTLIVLLVEPAERKPGGDRVVVLTRSQSGQRLVGERVGRTDAEGRCVFERVPPGAYHAFPPLSFGARVEVKAGETVTQEIFSADGGPLLGVVTDRRGAPIADASVWAVTTWDRDRPRVVVHTDAVGRFRLDFLDRSMGIELMATAKGFAPSGRSRIPGEKGRAAEVTLVLGDDGGRLEGRLTDASGKPVAGGAVEVSVPENDSSPAEKGTSVSPAPCVTRSDGEGRFVLEGMAPGFCKVRVRAAGYGFSVRCVVIESGKTTKVHVQLGRSATLVGEVIQGDGSPAVGATLSLRGLDVGPYSQLATDCGREGRFRLEGIPPGDYVVFVQAKSGGSAAHVERSVSLIEGEEVSLTFRLGSLRLAGTIESAGVSLVGASMLALPLASTFDALQGVVNDTTGEFLIEGGYPTDYRLALRLPNVVFPIVRSEPVRGGDQAVQWSIGPGALATASLTGRCDVAPNDPVRTLAGRLLHGGEGVFHSFAVDASGGFSITGIPKGTYRIRIFEDGVPVMDTPELALAADDEIELSPIPLR